MYEVRFYKDRNGKQPVEEYIRSPQAKDDKDSRIKAAKIAEYIEALRQCGTRAGAPYVKHIDGKIWELRPPRDRILFAMGDNGEIILLHCFVKKTQKAPAREIAKAKKILNSIQKKG